MKIIGKYVLKEHVGPFVFASTALTSLMLLQYVAKRLGELVGKGLPNSVIVEFLMLSLPFTVAMTLPMAVLVAVLYAFSRLASENEITAMKASGLSMSTVLAPVVVAMAVTATIIVGERGHGSRRQCQHQDGTPREFLVHVVSPGIRAIRTPVAWIGLSAGQPESPLPATVCTSMPSTNV